LTFVSPRGTPGQKSVQAKDRYGRTTELSGLKGFGYGIQQLATVQASRANPVDVIVDQQTGVALTAAGYFHQGFSKKQLLEESPGASVPESWRALSFDVQEARGPILVGGVGSLPSGSEGAVEIKRYMTLQKLASKQLENEVLIDQPQLTETEKADLARLQGTYLPLSVDSIRLQASQELEEGVWRKRLYVANGHGGVSRLNLDEQNGLQVTSEALVGRGMVQDIAQQDYALFGSTFSDVDADAPDEPCTNAPGPGVGLSVVNSNLTDPFDPVFMGSIKSLGGGSLLHYHSGWLYSNSNSQGI